MILHINHVPKKQVVAASNVASALINVAGEGQIPQHLLENLNVHLEWIQYKTNFREAITARRAVRGQDVLPWIELGVDLRQVNADCLKEEFITALSNVTDSPAVTPPASASSGTNDQKPLKPLQSGVRSGKRWKLVR